MVSYVLCLQVDSSLNFFFIIVIIMNINISIIIIIISFSMRTHFIHLYFLCLHVK